MCICTAFHPFNLILVSESCLFSCSSFFLFLSFFFPSFFLCLFESTPRSSNIIPVSMLIASAIRATSIIITASATRWRPTLTSLWTRTAVIAYTRRFTNGMSYRDWLSSLYPNLSLLFSPHLNQYGIGLRHLVAQIIVVHAGINCRSSSILLLLLLFWCSVSLPIWGIEWSIYCNQISWCILLQFLFGSWPVCKLASLLTSKNRAVVKRESPVRYYVITVPVLVLLTQHFSPTLLCNTQLCQLNRHQNVISKPIIMFTFQTWPTYSFKTFVKLYKFLSSSYNVTDHHLIQETEDHYS